MINIIKKLFSIHLGNYNVITYNLEFNIIILLTKFYFHDILIYSDILRYIMS